MIQFDYKYDEFDLLMKSHEICLPNIVELDMIDFETINAELDVHDLKRIIHLHESNAN